ncbi:MAG: transposase [Bacillota bacterium]
MPYLGQVLVVNAQHIKNVPGRKTWAGLSPGNNESAGKRKKAKTTKGNPLLLTTLIQAAKAASKTKDTYLSYQEMGADYFAKVNAKAIKNRAIKQLEMLGYQVKIEAA